MFATTAQLIYLVLFSCVLRNSLASAAINGTSSHPSTATTKQQLSSLQSTHLSSHSSASHSSHSSNHSKNEHHGIHVASIHFEYVKQPFILSIFLIIVVLAKIGFHYANFLSSWMPESCVLIILGLMVGGVLHHMNVDTSSFYYIDPSFFFLFLLPPCILEAAYGLHDQVFFQNLGTIIIYALVGTMLNCFLVGLLLYGLAICGAMGAISVPLIQCLVFSSLIVAVDPVAVLAIFQEIGVNNVLYFTVFGESLLNDAVTVVLYNTVVTLSNMEGKIPISEIGMAVAAFFTVSLGGLFIGLIFGFLSAIVTKFTLHVRMMESLAILSLAYASYLTAELFHFSGIISMIGCGLIQMQYAFHNISNNSSITIKYFIKMLSGACDCIIFMFLGIAVVRDAMDWHTGFILWTVVLCLVIRFLVTYGLTFFINRTHRKRHLGAREQFIMAYGGLRGAVAFCLVALLEPSEHKNLFRTTTIVIIFFTVFVQGITIKPLVKCLKIEGEETKIVSLYQEINSHVMDHLLMYIEELVGNYGYNSIQGFLNNLNDKYLKRFLQREPFTKDEIIMELYQQIIIQQHYESVYGVDTSSQMQIYKPELTEGSAMVFENMRISDQAEQLSKRLSSLESSKLDDGVLKSPATKLSDVAFALTSKMRRKASKSESDTKPVINKWKAASRHISGRMSIFSADDAPTPDSRELRLLLTQGSARDVFSRHSDRNLLDGDKSDLMLMLNEKQLRHKRFRSGVSQASTPGLSRAESLENELSKPKSSKAFLNKRKTFDFNSKPNTAIERKYGNRFLSKRPQSAGLQPSDKTLNELVQLMPLKEEVDLSSCSLSPHPAPHSAPQSPYKAPYNDPGFYSANQSFKKPASHSPTQKAPLASLERTPSLVESPPIEPEKPPSKRCSFRRQDANESHLQGTHEECL